jgi:hypothetical protein
MLKCGGSQLMRFIAPMVEHMARRCVGHLTNLPTAATPGAANLRSLSPVRHRRTTTSLGPAAGSPARKLKRADVPVLTWLAAALTHEYLNRAPVVKEIGWPLALATTMLAR